MTDHDFEHTLLSQDAQDHPHRRRRRIRTEGPAFAMQPPWDPLGAEAPPWQRTVWDPLGGAMQPGSSHLPAEAPVHGASLQFMLEELPAWHGGVQRQQAEETDAVHRAAQHGVSGQGGRLPHLEIIQRSFGPEHDLSGVRAHVGGQASEAARQLGASAYATGDRIAFADAPDLRTVAHEAAHVVQQRAGVQLSGGVGRAGDEHEKNADAVAERVVRGEPAAELLSPRSSPTTAVQRFAPDGHRKATAAGLKDSFGADEIGLIYQANWERDFSQASPKIADVVLTWKRVKESAKAHGGMPDQVSSVAFRSAMWAIITMSSIDPLLDSKSNTLGGYRSWEHMDRPGEDAVKDADQRWGAVAQEIPGYIADGRAYLMDMMVQAVLKAWRALGRDTNGLESWSYRTGAPATTAPMKVPDPRSDRGVVSREASQAATSMGARNVAAQPAIAAAADPLGRATHALEDFFAHSNWLELARRLKGGQKVAPRDLATGTFETPDKCHALGHKLVALTTSLLSDFDLLLKAYGQKSERTPGAFKRAALAIDTAPLRNDAMGSALEMKDLALAGGLLEADMRVGILDVEDFVCNRQYLSLLKHKGELLIAQGHKDAPKSGHGKMAKDQAESGKDYAGAHALAVAANRMLIAPLRSIMLDPDHDAAMRRLAELLALACRIVTTPNPDHPLLGMVH